MNPLIQHSVTMAYHPTDSSKLQAALSFNRLAATSTQVSIICQSRQALDALKHLASQDAHDISTEAMKAWLSICKIENKDTLQDLVVEYEIMQFLSKQLMHFDIDVKSQAAECVGELSKWNFISRRLVSDKALQPLCSLIRPNQNWKILHMACYALSKISSFSDVMHRVIIVWGITPLQEMIDKLCEQIQKQATTLQKMSPVERRMNSNKLDPSLDMLHASCLVWENFSKYEKLATKMLEHGIIMQLFQLLQSEYDVRIRVTAAKSILHLTDHKPVRTYILSQEKMLLAMFSRSIDSNFEVKHSIAKALDNLLETCTKSEHAYLQQLISNEISNSFIDWMLKTVNCNHILAIALESLISSNNIITKENQSAFGTEFFINLMSKIKSSVDFTVKRMSTEALYRFSQEPCFRKGIMNAQAPEMLVYMLSSKEIMFRSFAVNTISQLCDCNERITRFLDLGLENALLRYYCTFTSEVHSNRSNSQDQFEILANVSRIILALCDFGDFRNAFVNHKAMACFLNTFDTITEKVALNISIRIMSKLVSSAGKEGAGNGNLKVINERRLYRILRLLSSPDLPNSKIQQNIIELIKTYIPHQNIPTLNRKKSFWEVCFKEILKLIVPQQDSSELYTHEEHKACLMQLLYSILKNAAIQKQLETSYLMRSLLEVLILVPSVSNVSLYAAQSLLSINSHQSSQFRDFIVEHSEYLKKFGINAHSMNEVYKKFVNYLNDYINHFEENKLLSLRVKRENRVQTNVENDTNSVEESITTNENIKSKEVEHNNYELLQKWKASFGTVPTYHSTLLDIETPKVRLRIDESKLKGDIEPKLKRRMLRQIKEYERLNKQSNHTKT